MLANTDDQPLMASVSAGLRRDPLTGSVLRVAPRRQTSFVASPLHRLCCNNHSAGTLHLGSRCQCAEKTACPLSPMSSVVPGKCRPSFPPPSFWTVSRCSVKNKTPFFFFSSPFTPPARRGQTYAPCCAATSGARSRSASIIFICAFSDNVPGIVRTLYNGVITANNKVRGIPESPPLHVLWLPEPGGAAARLLPGDCAAVASFPAAAAAPAHPTCRGGQAVTLSAEVLGGASALPRAASVPRC